MKKIKVKNRFLDELRKVPIVQVACEKSDISRNSIYRWRKEDQEFRNEMDKALQEGVDLINDMTESQLLLLIKEKNWPAISFWLKHRNPKFREKLEVTTKFERVEEPLTAEEENLIREGLKLALPSKENGKSKS